MNTVSASRVRRVRHELKLREVEVTRVESLTPHFRSVTLQGPSLADFVSASFDDHVKIIIQPDGGEPVRRDYTPRRFNASKGELVVEFALHGDGPAAEWAAGAVVGQRLTIGGPKGSLIIPVDYEWHLLVGDETALPAVARRLEELPATTRASVLIHTNDPADRRELSSAATLDQRWVSTAAELIAAVRGWTLPAGDGFAWCAGESSAIKSLRRILVEDKGHDRESIRAAAYWKRGAIGHHENLHD